MYILAMEYFPLGTLDNFINDKLYEDDTRKISLQLLEGWDWRIPSAASISFKSKSVSRQHCQVWFLNRQWWIRDVGSSGGTFLNGQRLYAEADARAGDWGSRAPPPYMLHDNDSLELGSGSNRSEHVMIQVSFKGWSKNRSSTEEQHQDRKIPAAVDREGETKLGNKTGMPQPPTLSISRL
jgi:pSer/pThr/pTyr-binding forkhead associated (FHA) protein